MNWFKKRENFVTNVSKQLQAKFAYLTGDQNLFQLLIPDVRGQVARRVQNML